MLAPLLALLPALGAAVARSAGFGEVATAMLAAPAFLFAPGWGFARARSGDPLSRALDAFWISAVLAVPAVLVGAFTDLGGPGALATAATFTALGFARRPAPRERSPLRERVAVGAVVAAVLFAGVSWRDTIARPLDAHWWYGPADAEDWGGSPPKAGTGWATKRTVGDALVLRPSSEAATLLGPLDGPVVVAVRGPVGATVRAGGAVARVEADPVERAEEGPVPRYLARGVTALSLSGPLAPGEAVPLSFSDPAESVVYVVPDPDALWALHGAGELRFVHYYQLLNMVEQVRWARELYGRRRVTDVQPPLGSYVAAGPLGLTGGDLPTQNVAFLWVVAATGLAGVAAIRAFAPQAPAVAWLLPAAAVVEHTKLMLEPGSAGMPDTLNAAALLGAVAALARPGPRFAAMGVLAQLSRYPGAVVAAIAAVLDGQVARAARMLAAVLTLAAAFGAWGAATGRLDGWLQTVWWETGPEHWHGETDPAALLGRVPRFYALWIGYAGGLPLLAALRWPRGTRVALGTALFYSLLLATVDHTPSHYFLPLLHLAAVATACTADAPGSAWTRHGLPILGVAGLLLAYALVPVTG